MVRGGCRELRIWDAMDGDGIFRRGVADGRGTVRIWGVRECFPRACGRDESRAADAEPDADGLPAEDLHGVGGGCGADRSAGARCSVQRRVLVLRERGRSRAAKRGAGEQLFVSRQLCGIWNAGEQRGDRDAVPAHVDADAACREYAACSRRECDRDSRAELLGRDRGVRPVGEQRLRRVCEHRQPEQFLHQGGPEDWRRSTDRARGEQHDMALFPRPRGALGRCVRSGAAHFGKAACAMGRCGVR